LLFIFSCVISEDEKDLVNHIFSKMNVKMYHISFGILRSHIEAEEAVAQTFSTCAIGLCGCIIHDSEFNSMKVNPIINFAIA